MIGIIFYKNQAKGKAQFQKIIENYKQLKIEIIKIRTSRYYDEVEFKNGDCWRAVLFSSNSRGYKCNIAYVEWNITEEEIYTIIEPMVILKPYTAIHIFY